ncbi:hypothetical protein [Fischerella thermalis]|nr:hypothetical protein [Fischerella thermalis]
MRSKRNIYPCTSHTPHTPHSTKERRSLLEHGRASLPHLEAK